MGFLSEVIFFLLGMVVMYVINYVKEYSKGYANEKGRQRAAGQKDIDKNMKDKEHIYDFVKSKDSKNEFPNINEINEELFKGKKDIDRIDELLKELEFEGKVSSIGVAGVTKETRNWRYIN